MGTIYSHDLDLAGYLPIQDLRRPLISQLDPDLQTLGAEGKLKRIEAFNEARALSHALSIIGLSLNDLRVPELLLARPLRQYELRIKHGNDAQHAGIIFSF